MHLPFDDIRYSPNASSNVYYFPFCGWHKVWFIWNKQKQHSKCCTWTESGPKNVPRPNLSNVGHYTEQMNYSSNNILLSKPRQINNIHKKLLLSELTWQWRDKIAL